MNTASLLPRQARAWWREPMMWLVVGGPLAVVVAAVVTAVIAIRGADPVLDTRVATPAVQARNHAASPHVPVPATVPAKP
jgi:uncharacterized protein